MSAFIVGTAFMAFGAIVGATLDLEAGAQWGIAAVCALIVAAEWSIFCDARAQKSADKP